MVDALSRWPLFPAAGREPGLLSGFRACAVALALPLLVAAALLSTIVSSLSIYPQSLSYFNELAGGPQNGHKHLLHSNLDWGQDLILLKEWLKEHSDVGPLYLAYYGYLSPEDMGVRYILPDRTSTGMHSKLWIDDIPRGWYAISVNYLRGECFRAPDGLGAFRIVAPNEFTCFLDLPPTRSLGASMRVYEIE